MATKPLLASPAPVANHNHTTLERAHSTAGSTNSRSSGYFPHQSPLANDETLANTLANAQTSHEPSQAPPADSVLAGPSTNHGKFTEEWDSSQRGSSVVDGVYLGSMHRTNSFASTIRDDLLPSKANTLKKKPSLRRSGSLKRSGSRRSMKAGSVRSLALQSSSDPDEVHSVFHCPVPTSGNPTEVLASRFQAWRRILKDLITYFREIQYHYEQRAKSTLKLANASSNINPPAGFLASGGIGDAMQIMRGFNKQAILEAGRAREIEDNVILALTGLRSDLQQKIKEIKNLSGDFKNSVEKEMGNTRHAVKALQEALGQTELDSALTTGKQDPYLLRLAVDRQVERQIDEENYLHQAYLNLENSGRELESIVVGEIQKAYSAIASILKREADTSYSCVEELRLGPIAMPKDHEWTHFNQKNGQLVDPAIPIRSAQHIHYPGRDHVACQELRAGLLERKSKYLKSYTAGWYVLSPTHLHEFKSADKAQAPVMSLYLPEQKLGSHSTEGGSSNKFILKGRQTGGMHRGHTWVFRAESHDTMMAWYEDIKALTGSNPKERSEFVRGHTRSISQSSHRSSASSDGEVYEEDDEPFLAGTAVEMNSGSSKQDATRRPQPGGRFPSDIQVNAQRSLQAPLSPSSVSSGLVDGNEREALISADDVGPDGGVARDLSPGYGSTVRVPIEEAPSHAAIANQEALKDGTNPYTSEPLHRTKSPSHGASPTTPVRAKGQRTESHITSRQNPVVEAGRRPKNVQREHLETTNGVEETAPDSKLAGVGVLRPATGQANHRATVAGHKELEGEAPASRLKPAEAEDGELVKPTPIRADSVPTISSLHIPGEYPKSTAGAL